MLEYLNSNYSNFEFMIILSVLVLLSIFLFKTIFSFIREKFSKYKKQIFYFTYYASIILYLLSLFSDSFYDNGDANGVFGFEVVIFGCLTVFSGGACLTWLANPFLWYSWTAYKKSNKAFLLSLVSSIFSLSFLLFDTIPNGITLGGTDGQYGGSIDSHITGLGLGYFLWISSSIIYLFGNYMQLDKKSINDKTKS